MKHDPEEYRRRLRARRETALRAIMARRGRPSGRSAAREQRLTEAPSLPQYDSMPGEEGPLRKLGTALKQGAEKVGEVAATAQKSRYTPTIVQPALAGTRLLASAAQDPSDAASQLFVGAAAETHRAARGLVAVAKPLSQVSTVGGMPHFRPNPTAAAGLEIADDYFKRSGEMIEAAYQPETGAGTVARVGGMLGTIMSHVGVLGAGLRTIGAGGSGIVGRIMSNVAAAVPVNVGQAIEPETSIIAAPGMLPGQDQQEWLDIAEKAGFGGRLAAEFALDLGLTGVIEGVQTGLRASKMRPDQPRVHELIAEDTPAAPVRPEPARPPEVSTEPPTAQEAARTGRPDRYRVDLERAVEDVGGEVSGRPGFEPLKTVPEPMEPRVVDRREPLKTGETSADRLRQRMGADFEERRVAERRDATAPRPEDVEPIGGSMDTPEATRRIKAERARETEGQQAARYKAQDEAVGQGDEAMGAREVADERAATAYEAARKVTSRPVKVRGKVRFVGGDDKYARMDNEKLIARHDELLTRMANAMDVEPDARVTAYNREQGDATVASGAAVNWAAGRVMGRLGRDGRLIDEVTAELKARGISEEEVMRKYTDKMFKGEAGVLGTREVRFGAYPGEPHRARAGYGGTQMMTGMAGAGVGATVGAAADDENRLRGAALGAVAGGLAGVVGGRRAEAIGLRAVAARRAKLRPRQAVRGAVGGADADDLLESGLVRYDGKVMDIEIAAEKHFGVTEDPGEAGYILGDGTMLDFSGKSEGGPAGMRSYDHRDIGAIYEGVDLPGAESTSRPYMVDFVARGSIRTHISDGELMISLTRQPTGAQERLLRSLHEDAGIDKVYVDVWDDEGTLLDAAWREVYTPRDIERAIDEAFEAAEAKGLKGERGSIGTTPKPQTEMELMPGGDPGDFPQHSVGKNVRAWLRDKLTSQGNLPEEVFQRMIAKNGRINAELRQVEFTLRDFRRAAQKTYKTAHPKAEDAIKLDQVLKGQADPSTIPEAMRPVIAAMRRDIDAMSARMLESGLIEGDLVATITKNMGVYATTSYRIHDFKSKWAKQVDPRVRNKVAGFLRQQMPDATEGEIQGKIEALLAVEDGPLAMIANGKLGAKDLSILTRKKNIAEEIRALWGEYEDPMVNYARSMTKMAALTHNHEFLTDVKTHGFDHFLFEKPVVKDGVSYSEQIAGAGAKTMEPLDGLYTTKEIKHAFETMDPEKLSALGQWYMRANGAVKYGKTILSPLTHTRNTVSNVGFAIAQGHLNIVKGKMAIAGVTETLGPPKWLATLSGMDEVKWRDYTKRLTSLGVMYETPRAGELQDVLRDAGADLELLVTQNVGAWRKGLRGAEQLYRAEDDVWKIYAFENEKARYARAKPTWSEKQLEEHVAKIVRNTYPTYSLVPKGIRWIRRLPFMGTFVSFPSEVIRVGGKTISQAMTEMADPAVRHIGMQRLVGLLVASAGLAVGGTVITRSIHGITKKDEEALRRFVAPWDADAPMFHLGRSPDGTDYRFINRGYTDPFGYLQEAAIAAMRGEDWWTKVAEAAKRVGEPFFGEEILWGKILDVARNKKGKEGGPVYNPQDSEIDQLADQALQIWNAFEPGAVSQFNRLYKAYTGIETATGRVYDPKTETAAMMTGHRAVTVDIANSLFWKMGRYKRDVSGARRVVSKTANRGGAVSDRELRRDYLQTVRSQRGLWDEMQKDIAAARLLGLTDERVRTALTNAGFGKKEANEAMAGVFRPYRPGSNFLGDRISDERRLGNRDQAQRLVDRRRRLRTLSDSVRAGTVTP